MHCCLAFTTRVQSNVKIITVYYSPPEFNLAYPRSRWPSEFRAVLTKWWYV